MAGLPLAVELTVVSEESWHPLWHLPIDPDRLILVHTHSFLIASNGEGLDGSVAGCVGGEKLHWLRDLHASVPRPHASLISPNRSRNARSFSSKTRPGPGQKRAYYCTIGRRGSSQPSWRRAAFEALRDEIRLRRFLFHQDPNRPLYADIDSCKAVRRTGVGAMVYYNKSDPPPLLEELVTRAGTGGDETTK
ncbi:hypothetical protein K402DRAFT_31658 [Aulographum hederae CBS 113979]|uniref:Uncharacterized protein n=1 Tax=Aulographum hederae CBS 113979 TaxID=1176131 RepID=A0A6G1H4U4_9PEZI|nr:hypothetical protein K402DRAFT_31658 [Aulographum hederae CBS 113979]